MHSPSLIVQRNNEPELVRRTRVELGEKLGYDTTTVREEEVSEGVGKESQESKEELGEVGAGTGSHKGWNSLQ